MAYNENHLYPEIIGKTLGETHAILAGSGITVIREIIRDGMPSVGTADYRKDRLNVITCTASEHGKDVRITQVKGIG